MESSFDQEGADNRAAATPTAATAVVPGGQQTSTSLARHHASGTSAVHPSLLALQPQPPSPVSGSPGGGCGCGRGGHGSAAVGSAAVTGGSATVPGVSGGGGGGSPRWGGGTVAVASLVDWLSHQVRRYSEQAPTRSYFTDGLVGLCEGDAGGAQAQAQAPEEAAAAAAGGVSSAGSCASAGPAPLAVEVIAQNYRTLFFDFFYITDELIFYGAKVNVKVHVRG